MIESAGSGYTFGDSADASRRLAVLAELFEPSTRALLDALPGPPPTSVVDLGCGPGHTTALLASAFPGAHVLGIDRSPDFVAEAHQRASAVDGRCRFAVGDVTAVPLPGTPADLVYARYLLSHLPRPGDLLAGWAAAAGPGGVVVVEEPLDIVTDDALFRDYLAVVADLMASQGGELYVGRQLAELVDDRLVRVLDRIATIDLPSERVAEMFWLNSRAWATHPHIAERHDPASIAALQDALDERRRTPDGTTARWLLGQVAVRAVSAPGAAAPPG